MLIKALVFGFSLMPNVVFAEKNNTDDFVLNVTNVDIQASEKVSADEIIRLLPELEKQQVNVSRLSKNIQIINDMGAMNLKTQFIPQDDGSYHAFVLVEDGKKDVYSVGVNNSGDDFTGNWRTSISYLKMVMLYLLLMLPPQIILMMYIKRWSIIKYFFLKRVIA